MSYQSPQTKRYQRHKKNDHRRPGVPPEFSKASRGVRLQKVLADAGLASRRDCERIIAEGRIRVNRQLVTALPAFVDPDHDLITVDGKSLARLSGARHRRVRKMCIMLNKPRHVISTADDPHGRTTVLDLIDIDDAPRLYPVGRLDAESTGLILLTNDGELAQQLTHPSFQVPKKYRVSIRGKLEEPDMALLKRGLILTHQRKNKALSVKHAQMAEVHLLSYGRGPSGDRTRLEITLYEGQNREIRRLLARIGFKVRRLERIAIGPLMLKGLATGHWRVLSDKEIRQLRSAAQQPHSGKHQATTSSSDSKSPPGSTPGRAPGRAPGTTPKKSTGKTAKPIPGTASRAISGKRSRTTTRRATGTASHAGASSRSTTRPPSKTRTKSKSRTVPKIKSKTKRQTPSKLKTTRQPKSNAKPHAQAKTRRQPKRR